MAYNIPLRNAIYLHIGNLGVLKTCRSGLEVIADILDVTLNGAHETRIMYKANLNFVRFHRYFLDVDKQGNDSQGEHFR